MNIQEFYAEQALKQTLRRPTYKNPTFFKKPAAKETQIAVVRMSLQRIAVSHFYGLHKRNTKLYLNKLL